MDKNKISAGTTARTLCLALALLNQCLAMLGKGTLDFVEDDVYQLVTLIFTFTATVAAWWKNNSFTNAAIKADKVMKELKMGEKDGNC